MSGTIPRGGGGKPTRDLTGQRFGRLVAREWLGLVDDIGGGQRNSYWRCDCDCGGQKRAKADSLRAGLILSCDCLRREKSATARARGALKARKGTGR